MNYFLGLQIEYTTTGLFFHQSKYAHDLLTKFNMLICKPFSNPCASTHHLVLSHSSLLSDPTAYRSLVSSLQYMNFIRLDLSYAFQQACQFMSKPTHHHLIATKRILRCLKVLCTWEFIFRLVPCILSTYCDTDWVGDPVDRRSITSMVVFLGGSPITWFVKKQRIVARSSTEVEYRSLAITTAELYWLRMLLRDLGVYLYHPPILWCGNVSALASNPIFYARTKHIEVDYHFFREKILNRDMVVKYISTLDQLYDIFTKSLPSPKFHLLVTKLMGVPPLSLRGDVKTKGKE